MAKLAGLCTGDNRVGLYLDGKHEQWADTLGRPRR